MSKRVNAVVLEPVRVTGPTGKHQTFRPVYEKKGDKKYKTSPVISVSEREFELFEEAGHLAEAPDDVTEVVFTGEPKNWKPVKKVKARPAEDDGDEKDEGGDNDAEQATEGSGKGKGGGKAK